MKFPLFVVKIAFGYEYVGFQKIKKLLHIMVLTVKSNCLFNPNDKINHHVLLESLQTV